jgi:DNA-binding GntR family transcriptional regulator
VGADEERILACVRKSSDPMSVSALSEETQIEATILRHILVRLAAKRRITMQVTDAGVRVRERAHTP